MNINARFNYPPPIATTLGFELVDSGDQTATIEMVTDLDKHANPMGTVHGGVLCDVADAAIGTAHAATLSDAKVSPVWTCKSIFSVPSGMIGFERSPGPCTSAKASADTSATSSPAMGNSSHRWRVQS